VQLDAEALRNGTVSLIHARGILPDGLPFQIPESDPLPPVRQVLEIFPPTRDKVTVLLAIPPRKPGGVNCVPVAEAPATPGTRYWAESHVLSDETTGRDEKPVHIGRKNMRIVLDTELSGEEIALPIARIMRDGAGSFMYDPQFIPPSVDLAAS